VAYNIGEPLIKLNKGPYRERYDESRERFLELHPDASKLHCHRHGMLLMTKLLLKCLWHAWREYA